MRLADVARARRDGGLAVLEGFHALKHATRFGAEVLGAWTADPGELEALRVQVAKRDEELERVEYLGPEGDWRWAGPLLD